MKTKLQRTVSAFLMVVLLTGGFFAKSMESHAASVCSQISGKSTATTVFYVNTGSRWILKDVMKFSQTKGVMNTSYSTTNAISGTVTIYEIYTIKIQKLNKNNKVISTVYKTFNQETCKISLDKNSKYKITVTPEYITHVNKIKNTKNGSWVYQKTNPYKGGFYNALTSKNDWVPRGWKKASTWKVTSTKGINDCRFSK